MQVATKTFRKWGNELSRNVTDEEGFDRNVSIVAARGCAMLYINDTRYSPEENTLKIEGINKPRNNNVQFFAK